MYIKKSNICRKSLKSYIIKERSNAVLKFFETPIFLFFKVHESMKTPPTVGNCSSALKRVVEVTMQQCLAWLVGAAMFSFTGTYSYMYTV